MKDRYWLLLICGIISLIIILLFIDAQNAQKEYAKNTWYQNATVIEKYSKWYGYDCIFTGDNGKRFYDQCHVSMVGDKLLVEMQKDYEVRIVKRWE